MPHAYDWDTFKYIVSELYLVDGLPLKQVMEVLRE